MKRLISVLLLVFTLTACSSSDTSNKTKIGVVLPFTGKAALVGESVRKGMELALADGGHDLELIYEDNGLDNMRTVTTVKKLIEVDGVAGLVIYASGPSNTAAPIAEQAKVSMVGMSVDPKVVRGRNWVMKHWASNVNIVDTILRELAAKKIARVAMLTSQVDGNIEIGSYFLQAATKAGVEIVYDEKFMPEEKDYRSALAVIKAKKPQGVFVNLYYGQAGVFAAQARELGLKSQLFSHFVFDNTGEIASANGTLDGAFFANTSNGDLSFNRAYEAKYGGGPLLGSISGFDIVSMFGLAAKEGGKDKAKINAFLHAIKDFPGKVGTYSATAENDFNVPADIRYIEGGKIVSK